MNDQMSWSELAELTHKTQVEKFNWCSCEDNDGQENPYSDCPKIEVGNCSACNSWDDCLENTICQTCISEQTVVYCGDCLYPLDQCEHGREFKK
jgi:hypothetical protein